VSFSVSGPVRSRAGAKPRVLLVEDHRGVLDTVSGLLADDFDVVGVATDGSQALQAARQVTPDAIVLDVGMPGLDGFQTAEGCGSLPISRQRWPIREQQSSI
jgi:CheY-like chemotaxis protein